MINLIFYGHRDPTSRFVYGPYGSVFLAGPTSRAGRRTPWRQEAIDLFKAADYNGALIIPESESGVFEESHFLQPPSPTPALRTTSYNILAWETCGIERASLVLFWMPFSAFSAEENGPEPMPGWTTRAEVSRELAREPERLILGMPPGALSGSHIRYHAHHAGVPVHATLAETVTAALTRLRLGRAAEQAQKERGILSAADIASMGSAHGLRNIW